METSTEQRPRLGAHLSLGTAPRTSLGNAGRDGVECVQIFASSPGAWKPPVLKELRVAEVAAVRAELGIDPLFIHAIYLINLASENPTLVARSRASLIATLQAGEALGARGVVTHIGSHGGRGFDAVADQVADQLATVLAATPDTVQLILENSAGAGGIIGSRLDELATLIQRAGGQERLNVALDTAHLCAAGWDFAADGHAAARLVEEVDGLIGLDRLALIHANDSRTPAGSRRDRHANVGEGCIGLAGFRSLARQRALRRIPWVLETPDLGTPAGDDGRFASLATIRGIMSASDGDAPAS